MPHRVKHTIKYKNHNEWIPKEIYTLIPRVTEVCNTLTCMFPAWQNDVNRIKRGEEPLEIRGNNYAALRGTLTHYDIQLFVDDQIGVETEPLELLENENQLLIQQKEQGTIDDLYDEVARGVEVLIKWWDMYDPIPVVSEQEILHVKKDENGYIDVTKSLKGTVDFVGEIHLDRLSKTALTEVKAGHRTLDYEIIDDKFTAMIDWKSGKDAWKAHGLQLTAYDYLLNDSGWWAASEKSGLIKQPPFTRSIYGFESRFGMCVKTGGKKPLTTLYDVGEYKEFFRAWDLFNNAENTTYSQTQKRATGLKRICMFCEYRNYGCPLFSFSRKGELQLV